VTVFRGSQATFWEGARILNHSDVGVDVFDNGQAFFAGDYIIQGNATSTDPTRAALRVDGNSQASLEGGQILQNGGPGILVLVNSSVDFSKLVFGSNAGGLVVCDSSAYMVSDLSPAQANPSSGIMCRTPHNLGNHQRHRMAAPHVPDWSKQKARHNFYQKVLAEHSR
jgi:hypothetical protein